MSPLDENCIPTGIDNLRQDKSSLITSAVVMTTNPILSEENSYVFPGECFNL